MALKGLGELGPGMSFFLLRVTHYKHLQIFHMLPRSTSRCLLFTAFASMAVLLAARAIGMSV